MDRETKRLINELTQDVIDAFQIQIPIKDMEEVVRRLGGEVIEDNSLSMYSDGFITKQGQGFRIVVSSFQSGVRKNFTIAHELGHLFLHMGYKIDNQLWNSQDEKTYYRNGSSEQEYQANEFAAALLMPEGEYKKVMDQNTYGNSVDTNRMAEHFNVSSDAAANRGKWLGYLQW